MGTMVTSLLAQQWIKTLMIRAQNKNMFGEAVIAVFVHVASKQTWVDWVYFNQGQRRIHGTTKKWQVVRVPQIYGNNPSAILTYASLQVDRARRRKEVSQTLYINYQPLGTDYYLFIKYLSPLHVSSLKCSS